MQENKFRRTELQSRVSSQKLAAGNCYAQFLKHNSNKSSTVLFLAEDGIRSRVEKRGIRVDQNLISGSEKLG